jgi:ATP-binding cassette subfamily F protein 3
MQQYDGTVVVVSHNRYFLDSFINKVLVVKDGGITLHQGNVAEYLERRAEEQEERQALRESAQEKIEDKADNNGVSRKEQRQIEARKRQQRSRKLGPWAKKLAESEEQVEKLENLKEKLEEKMADPELYTDEDAWSSTSRQYEDCNRQLQRWYERWEEAQAKIDQLDAELEES